MVSSLPAVRVFHEAEIRELVTYEDAVRVVSEAFVAHARGQCVSPAPIQMDLEGPPGEVHVKGAHVAHARNFAFKIASGFYGNSKQGLPAGSGIVVTFDSQTGFPTAVLLDNGWLTDLRTAAAGTVASRALAREDPQVIAIVGTGVQARLQLEGLMTFCRRGELRVAGRTDRHVRSYATEMSRALDCEVKPMATVEAAVDGADIVVTTTPAREPIVRYGWIGEGAHITAVGSDMPLKQELDARLVAACDVIAADSIDACIASGEIHHAVAEKLIEPGRIVELGAVLAGDHAGRQSDGDRTLADLTGLGVQDAAIADLVVTRGEPNPGTSVKAVRR